MKRIAVVTGTRAEYGLLTPILEKVDASPLLELQLFVTGMHLLHQFGYTKKFIQERNWPTIIEVPMYQQDYLEQDRLGQALAAGIAGFSSAFVLHKPDLVVVLGDRMEPLAAALAALSLNIPVAHIHGGDRIDSGHIDESIRHMLTKLAHIHFAASPLSAKRILNMGEQPNRVHIVGAPGIDVILNATLPSSDSVKQELGLPPDKPYILCTQHPVSLESTDSAKHYRNLLEVLAETEQEIVLIQPNNDEGSQGMLAVLAEFNQNPHFHVFSSLAHLQYLAVLKYCEFLIGNTSSGILETPALGKPFIHVGTRNKGRDHGTNVVFTSYEKKDIEETVHRLLHDSNYRQQLNQSEWLFGDGHAAERIVKVLEEIELGPSLLKKTLTY